MKNEIGRGSFATVYKAQRESDGEHFAIKMLSKQHFGYDKNSIIEREIEIL